MASTIWVTLLVAAAFTAVMAYLQRRHIARVRLDRAALFDDAKEVLDDARVIPRGLDFPLLYGWFEGRQVRVEPIVDTATMRTIPVLRLAVTMREQLPGQPRLSALANENGQEFYAGHRDLPRWRDPAWPEWASVACEANGVDPELAIATVNALTEDSSVKQVLVTDRGVRCVIRAAKSDSATYRVTRRVDVSGTRVTDESLRHAAEIAHTLCDLAARRPVSLTESAAR